MSHYKVGYFVGSLATASINRKLAKAHHPDQNKDDPKAQQKFAEISSAYDFLTDADKRAWLGDRRPSRAIRRPPGPGGGAAGSHGAVVAAARARAPTGRSAGRRSPRSRAATSRRS